MDPGLYHAITLLEKLITVILKTVFVSLKVWVIYGSVSIV